MYLEIMKNSNESYQDNHKHAVGMITLSMSVRKKWKRRRGFFCVKPIIIYVNLSISISRTKGNQSTSHGAPTPDLQIEIEQASSHDSDIAKSKAAKVADNEYRAMLSDWQTDVLKAYTHQNNIQNGAKEE